ncbi:MAG: hypothetical protein NT124_02260 [Candidatus Dependentiae bacterium]|nr:hypothetical protein [Candidatus Dependentiae bacterium]
MKIITLVRSAVLLLGVGLLTGGADIKAMTCELRKKAGGLTSEEVKQLGACIGEAIAKWSGAAGAKSIFMSASDPQKRTTNVLDGDNDMPNATVQRTTGAVTGPRLGWTPDLYIAQSYLKKYAPNSASLKQAWNQIRAADLIIQNTLTIANEKKDDTLADKVNFFSALIPTVVQPMLDSLTKEFATVSGVGMWTYGTEASKKLTLAIIPVIKTALQRIITNFKLLEVKNRATTTAQNASSMQTKDIEKLNREKQAYVPEILKIFNNRNKEQADTPLKPSDIKKMADDARRLLGSDKGKSPSVTPAAATQPATAPAPKAPVTPPAAP